MNLLCEVSCRNYLSITTIAIASFALFTASTVNALDTVTPAPLPVTVYQHTNFGGNSYDVDEGDVSIAELRASSVGNNRISSIEIAPGYQVFACLRSRFRGQCETFTSDVLDLRDINFNDDISSLRVSKVPAGPVTVYRDVNFGGNFLDADEGDVSIADLRASSVGNDRISSIRIAPGYEVMACRNSRLNGRCETFSSDVSDLRVIGFNNVISSLMINRIGDQPPLTTFYADNDQDGFGDPDNSSDFELADAPVGFVSDNTDCDDRNGAIFPGADELADGLDNNCNGVTDEVDPGPGPGVFAIAYTNVNGIPGFDESADVMIAQWIDGPVASPDGVIGSGDIIEFGQYPTSFTGTSLAGFVEEDFNAFSTSPFIVDTTTLFAGRVRAAVSTDLGQSFVSFESTDFTQSLRLDVAPPVEPGENIIFGSPFIRLSDDINLGFIEIIDVEARVSSIELFTSRATGDGDDRFIDVDIFFPTP